MVVAIYALIHIISRLLVVLSFSLLFRFSNFPIPLRCISHTMNLYMPREKASERRNESRECFLPPSFFFHHLLPCIVSIFILTTIFYVYTLESTYNSYGMAWHKQQHHHQHHQFQLLINVPSFLCFWLHDLTETLFFQRRKCQANDRTHVCAGV